MLFPIHSLVAFISQRFPLEHRDLILTGTPEGVGQLRPGDHVCAWVAEEASGRVLSRGAWRCELGERL